MFFVTLLNHLYWVCGAVAGALLGYVIHFDTTGIEFVMTALFVVMFMGQWEEHPDHRPALIGLVIPIVCLFVFGSQNFIIPSMALIIVCFMALKKYYTEYYYDCCRCTGNHGDQIPAISDFSGRKDTACLYSVSGKGASLCSDRSSRYLLPEGCASQLYLWIAGSHCDPVYHGTA